MSQTSQETNAVFRTVQKVTFMSCDWRILIHCVVPENIHTPPTEGFSSLTPHPPGFSVPEGLAVLPPTPRKFHDFAT